MVYMLWNNYEEDDAVVVTMVLDGGIGQRRRLYLIGEMRMVE